MPCHVISCHVGLASQPMLKSKTGSEKREAGSAKGICEPDIVIVTLFSKAGPNRGALFLDDSSLVGNGLGRTYITDELLDYID